jgi:hypothetical protein
MFFAKAPACHHPERALAPLECPCCARRPLCCYHHLLLRRHWNYYRCRRRVVWKKDRATPSRLEVKGVLAEAESGSLKFVHFCFDTPRAKSGEFITCFSSNGQRSAHCLLAQKTCDEWVRYKKVVHIIKQWLKYSSNA